VRCEFGRVVTLRRWKNDACKLRICSSKVSRRLRLRGGWGSGIKSSRTGAAFGDDLGEMGSEEQDVPDDCPRSRVNNLTRSRPSWPRAPIANGYSNDVWTLQRVAEVIERTTGVQYLIEIGRLPHPNAHVWDLAFDRSGTELQSTANDGTTRRWTIAIEPPVAPAYLADAATGEGASWIDDDVDAFARLIASRQMSPPLSIAIFGEWGSGKTFFMKRLQRRINELTEQARASHLRQRDVGYYKHRRRATPLPWRSRPTWLRTSR
jgi:hypothetical protein